MVVRPAQGEGAAVGGYHYQYLVSASLVLKGLMNADLEWVRLKDVEAGRVDDFVLRQRDGVHGYQMKQRTAPPTFTFRDLTIPERGRSTEATARTSHVDEPKPCLIRQLAEGWQLLRRQHGPRVVVHLVTNARSSTHDSIDLTDGATGPRHFTAFLREAWTPAHTAASGIPPVVPGKWSRTWDAIQQASGLGVDQFASFVRDCELEFEIEPESLLPEDASRDAAQALHDIDDIRHLLFDVVAREPAPVQLDRSQLLNRLNWSQRFEDRHIHVFPVDEALYHPIERSVADLEDALSTTTRGYLSVIGSPGSGKSTMLTQVLRFRPERVVRYYAFVPDDPGSVSDRSESVNFLHDLVLDLHRKGVTTGESTIGFDRLALRERLKRQLRLLHDEWSATGMKTVILVDGLDHASRLSLPEQTFLRDLPHPSDVPDGVVIVLGSQTDAPLPNFVREEARTPGRRIDVQPLGRPAVLDILSRAELPFVLTGDQRAGVVQLSAGHPLALVYLLNALRNASTNAEVGRILNETPAFTGDIAARYQAAWEQIADSATVEALGYVARLRGAIDLNWLRRHVGPGPIYTIGHRFGHFFKHEVGQRWYFFHDSFRVFLLQRTSETWEGHPDATRDAELHQQLANWLADEPDGAPRAWDELYHRARAGEDDVVVERATQAYFRSQVFAHRPIEAIRGDITIALRSAARRQDPVALARLVLAGTELSQRQSHLDDVPLIQWLLELHEPLIALEHLRVGWRLRSDAVTALRVCPQLEEAGYAVEAQRLFELAEPLDLLGGHRPVEIDAPQESRKTLAEWAQTAHRYRPVEQVIVLVRRLSFTSMYQQRPDTEDLTQSLQDELVFRAGVGLVEDRRWNDLEIVAAALDPANGSDVKWWFWLHVRAWRNAADAGDDSEAQRITNMVLGRFSPEELDSRERIAVAEAALQILRDQTIARRWVDGIAVAEIDESDISSDAGFAPFDLIYRVHRINSALGRDVELPATGTRPPNRSHPGIARFVALVSTVARIDGEVWRGEETSAATLLARIEPEFELFDRTLNYHGVDTSWYLARQARSDLLERLIAAFKRLGVEAVRSVQAALERSWNRIAWANTDRRAGILALAEAGVPSAWVVDALSLLENEMLEGLLTIERIGECDRQIEAWLQIGELDAARHTLSQLLEESSAIAFRKDHQLAAWIRYWLPEINACEPEQAADRIRWFVGATLVLEVTTEEGADETAAEALLGATFRWRPRRSINLLEWFLEQQLLPLDDAVSELALASLDTSEAPVELVRTIVAEILTRTPNDGPSFLLLRRLLAAQQGIHGSQSAIETACILAERARMHALPAGRRYWRQGLTEALHRIGLSEVGTPIEFLPLHDRSPRSRDWGPQRDGNGSGSQTASAMRQPNSVEALREMLLQDGGDTGVDWAPTVEGLAMELGEQDLDELLDLFLDRRNGAAVMIRVGRSLAARGQRSLAQTFLRAALDAPEVLGWDRLWGGGEKFDAAQSLVELDSRAARPVIFDCLARAIEQDPILFGSLSRNLHELLPLLVQQVPVPALWAEIEEFVSVLFAPHTVPSVALPWLDEAGDQEGPVDGLADLVTMLLRYPVLVLRQGAQRVLAWGIVHELPAFLRGAKDALSNGSELQQIPVLEVLTAISAENPGKLVPLREQVIPLGASPNFAVRSITHSICARLGWDLDRPPHLSRPAEYALLLPPEPPEEIRLFSEHLESVAQAAGIREESVIWRAANLMRIIADPDVWSPDADARIARSIDAARVYLPYLRPRASVARSAFFRVVAELADDGDLCGEDLERLRPWLTTFDPAMVLAEPVSRPDVIEVMTEPRYESGGDTGWLAAIDELCDAYSALPTAAASALLIAERTEFRRVGFEYRTETRKVTLEPADGRDPSNQEFVARRRVAGVPLTMYADMQVATRPEPLILENVPLHFYDTPSPRWLALNPAIAHDLGWHLGAEDLPSWNDSAGNPMVWSLWWSDGVLDTSQRAQSSTVGEGWLVLASDDGFNALRDLVGQIEFRVHGKRTLASRNQFPAREAECQRLVRS